MKIAVLLLSLHITSRIDFERTKTDTVCDVLFDKIF